MPSDDIHVDTCSLRENWVLFGTLVLQKIIKMWWNA